MRFAVMSCAVLVGLAGAPAAWAQPGESPTPDPLAAETIAAAGSDRRGEEAAKAHFKSGVALLKDGNYGGAVAEFEASYGAFPRAVTLYNLALALKGLKRYGDAVARFRRYLAEAKDIDPKERQEVEGFIAELSALLADVRLDVSPAGAGVRIDGREVGKAPLELLRLGAGIHRIEVALDGHKAAEREVTVVAGKPVTIEIVLEPEKTTGTARISTSPAGAVVDVDARPSGTTPVELELPAGSHVVELLLSGYERHRADLAIEAGQLSDLQVALEKAAPESRRKLWIALGVVGGALVAGAVATGVALGTQTDERVLPSWDLSGGM